MRLKKKQNTERVERWEEVSDIRVDNREVCVCVVSIHCDLVFYDEATQETTREQKIHPQNGWR